MPGPRRLELRRPKLPVAHKILPYLEEIDATRWYTNFGPLTTRFRARLAAELGLADDELLLLANGTVALEFALRDVGARPGDLCAMPSFTFPATAAAALSVGLVPWFIDVSPDSWSMDPAAVAAAVADAPGNVGAVLPVSPFGAPIDADRWDRFQSATGIPVVADLAWAFDNAGIGRAPAMISLHATKAFGIGEGAILAWRDPDRIANLQRLSNFGLDGERHIAVSGTNAKLSEYAAAVGLAALDEWPERRQALRSLAAHYRNGLSGLPAAQLLPGLDGSWAPATMPVRLSSTNAEDVVARLADVEIEARAWWGRPCHEHGAYAALPRQELPVTAALSRTVINLPFSPDLTTEDIDRVVGALADILDDTNRGS